MKTVILCGGRGTRLNELGTVVPKALVPIGGRPIIWHLMNKYAAAGHSDFILCLGFLGDKIREWVGTLAEPWSVLPVDTGLDTNTGGRLKSVENEIAADGPFFVTYGDGLSDVDLASLLGFHREHGRIATLTAVHPVSSFGILDLAEDGAVRRFNEKPVLREWINGGFFVFEPKIFARLSIDSVLEREPLAGLAADSELVGFRHEGFWKCMDTYKDNLEFEELWARGAPW